jgi:hypothetical protein
MVAPTLLENLDAVKLSMHTKTLTSSLKGMLTRQRSNSEKTPQELLRDATQKLFFEISLLEGLLNTYDFNPANFDKVNVSNKNNLAAKLADVKKIMLEVKRLEDQIGPERKSKEQRPIDYKLAQLELIIEDIASKHKSDEIKRKVEFLFSMPVIREHRRAWTNDAFMQAKKSLNDALLELSKIPATHSKDAMMLAMGRAKDQLQSLAWLMQSITSFENSQQIKNADGSGREVSEDIRLLFRVNGELSTALSRINELEQMHTAGQSNTVELLADIQNFVVQCGFKIDTEADKRQAEPAFNALKRRLVMDRESPEAVAFKFFSNPIAKLEAKQIALIVKYIKNNNRFDLFEKLKANSSYQELLKHESEGAKLRKDIDVILIKKTAHELAAVAVAITNPSYGRDLFQFKNHSLDRTLGSMIVKDKEAMQRFSNFVQLSILDGAANLTECHKLIEKWLFIAKELLQLKSYGFAHQIYSALSSAAVGRLFVPDNKFILSPSLHEIWKELSEVFNPRPNFSNYTAIINQHMAQGVSFTPAIGIMTTTMTFTDDGNEDGFPRKANQIANISMALCYAPEIELGTVQASFLSLADPARHAFAKGFTRPDAEVSDTQYLSDFFTPLEHSKTPSRLTPEAYSLDTMWQTLGHMMGVYPTKDRLIKEMENGGSQIVKGNDYVAVMSDYLDARSQNLLPRGTNIQHDQTTDKAAEELSKKIKASAQAETAPLSPLLVEQRKAKFITAANLRLREDLLAFLNASPKTQAILRAKLLTPAKALTSTIVGGLASTEQQAKQEAEGINPFIKDFQAEDKTVFVKGYLQDYLNMIMHYTDYTVHENALLAKAAKTDPEIDRALNHFQLTPELRNHLHAFFAHNVDYRANFLRLLPEDHKGSIAFPKNLLTILSAYGFSTEQQHVFVIMAIVVPEFRTLLPILLDSKAKEKWKIELPVEMSEKEKVQKKLLRIEKLELQLKELEARAIEVGKFDEKRHSLEKHKARLQELKQVYIQEQRNLEPEARVEVQQPEAERVAAIKEAISSDIGPVAMKVDIDTHNPNNLNSREIQQSMAREIFTTFMREKSTRRPVTPVGVAAVVYLAVNRLASADTSDLSGLLKAFNTVRTAYINAQAIPFTFEEAGAKKEGAIFYEELTYSTTQVTVDCVLKCAEGALFIVQKSALEPALQQQLAKSINALLIKYANLIHSYGHFSTKAGAKAAKALYQNYMWELATLVKQYTRPMGLDDTDLEAAHKSMSHAHDSLEAACADIQLASAVVFMLRPGKTIVTMQERNGKIYADISDPMTVPLPKPSQDYNLSLNLFKKNHGAWLETVTEEHLNTLLTVPFPTSLREFGMANVRREQKWAVESADTTASNLTLLYEMQRTGVIPDKDDRNEKSRAIQAANNYGRLIELRMDEIVTNYHNAFGEFLSDRTIPISYSTFVTGNTFINKIESRDYFHEEFAIDIGGKKIKTSDDELEILQGIAAATDSDQVRAALTPRVINGITYTPKLFETNHPINNWASKPFTLKDLSVSNELIRNFSSFLSNLNDSEKLPIFLAKATGKKVEINRALTDVLGLLNGSNSHASAADLERALKTFKEQVYLPLAAKPNKTPQEMAFMNLYIGLQAAIYLKQLSDFHPEQTTFVSGNEGVDIQKLSGLNPLFKKFLDLLTPKTDKTVSLESNVHLMRAVFEQLMVSSMLGYNIASCKSSADRFATVAAYAGVMREFAHEHDGQLLSPRSSAEDYNEFLDMYRVKLRLGHGERVVEFGNHTTGALKTGELSTSGLDAEKKEDPERAAVASLLAGLRKGATPKRPKQDLMRLSSGDILSHDALDVLLDSSSSLELRSSSSLSGSPALNTTSNSATFITSNSSSVRTNAIMARKPSLDNVPIAVPVQADKQVHLSLSNVVHMLSPEIGAFEVPSLHAANLEVNGLSINVKNCHTISDLLVTAEQSFNALDPLRQTQQLQMQILNNALNLVFNSFKNMVQLHLSKATATGTHYGGTQVAARAYEQKMAQIIMQWHDLYKTNQQLDKSDQADMRAFTQLFKSPAVALSNMNTNMSHKQLAGLLTDNLHALMGNLHQSYAQGNRMSCAEEALHDTQVADHRSQMTISA